MKEFTIGKTKVGGSHPCFIVAEIGINFDGSYEKALRLIDSAAAAGCSAVKFQLFKASKMYLPTVGDEKSGHGRKNNIYKIVEDAELPKKWILSLKKYANAKGLEFFSTTCEVESTNDLERYGMPAYKIASAEISHIPLIRHVAKKNKPIIFSSGDATLFEIAEALQVFSEEKNDRLALLHCTLDYPAPLKHLNLNVLKTFRLAFPNLVIGYSDHSKDAVTAPVAAVALGAKIIEKHITLDSKSPGPDHIFALDPENLALMVKKIRETEQKMKKGITVDVEEVVLGTSEKNVFSKIEKMTREFGFRCIFAKKLIKKGERLTKNNMIILRPGNAKRGLHPRYYELLVKGYRASRNIASDASITWDDVLSK